MSDAYKANDHLNMFSSANILIEVLTNDRQKSNFYTETLLKGIRTYQVYVTDLSIPPVSDITADDNGTIFKTRDISKLCCLVGEAKTTHKDKGKFY